MFDVEMAGLEGVDRLLREIPGVTTSAARMAVNDAAQFGRTRGVQAIAGEVRLKPSYLKGRTGNGAARLGVTKRAKNTDLEAVVTGRDRPTSLARFKRGAFAPGAKRQVKVQVRTTGGPKAIPGAFYIRLRRGSASVTEEAYNEGIALRLKKGDNIPGKSSMAHLRGGLYVLYGPSVGQVYRSVAAETAGPIADNLQARFDHHFTRALRG